MSPNLVTLTLHSVIKPNLRAKSGLFVERSADEHAVLLRRDLALSPDADAAGMANHLADHVLRGLPFDGLHVRLPAADRPLSDVVRPDVGGHRSRRLAVAEIEESFCWYSDTKKSIYLYPIA